MDRTIFAVMAGSYEERGVEALFERREDAEAFAETLTDPEDRPVLVEKFGLYGPGERPGDVVVPRPKKGS